MSEDHASWDFPGGSVVKTSHSSAGDVGSISGQGDKIPHTLWSKRQNVDNRSNIVTNLIKTLKMIHIKKRRPSYCQLFISQTHNFSSLNALFAGLLMELNEITCLKGTSYRFWLLIAVTFLYMYLTKEFERTSYRALGHSFMKGTICNDFPIFQCSNSTFSQMLSKLWPIEIDTISQVMSQDVSSIFPFTVPLERRSLLKLDEGGGNFSKWNEEPECKTTQKFVVQLLKSCPTLQAHGLQHARLSFHSLSPGVCSDSYSLSQWWYLTISSSVALFSSCPQSFPASGSFPMSWLFTSGGQSIVLELQHQSFQWVLRVDFL